MEGKEHERFQLYCAKVTAPATIRLYIINVEVCFWFGLIMLQKSKIIILIYEVSHAKIYLKIRYGSCCPDDWLERARFHVDLAEGQMDLWQRGFEILR